RRRRYLQGARDVRARDRQPGLLEPKDDLEVLLLARRRVLVGHPAILGCGSMQVGQGTRVLVTGASRGLGRAIAEAFAWRGCMLGLVARSEDELRSLADELPGDLHKIFIADVANRHQIGTAVEAFG